MRKPALGDYVEFETPDGMRRGVVDLVMPEQFAVILDEEFWVYRQVTGVGSIPTGTRAIIKFTEVWCAIEDE